MQSTAVDLVQEEGAENKAEPPAGMGGCAVVPASQHPQRLNFHPDAATHVGRRGQATENKANEAFWLGTAGTSWGGVKSEEAISLGDISGVSRSKRLTAVACTFPFRSNSNSL